jgi:hypothetical protein
MEVIGLEMGVSSKSKKRKLLQWNLRPDSTAVNSWAINNVMKESISGIKN